MSSNRTAVLARDVVQLLIERQQTVATAESLTGGGLGALLTSVPGASAVYRGGLITYATDLKASLADVAQVTLDAHGPVSAGTAAEMAVGAAIRCRARWGLSTTGAAGPDPQDGHAPGQVYAGFVDLVEGTAEVANWAFSGTREEIRGQTATAVLLRLAELLGRTSA